jgi:hypothetical protein
MVNKTFLPPALRPRKTPKRFKSLSFLNWHGIRSDQWRTALAWESLRRFDGVAETLGRAAK